MGKNGKGVEMLRAIKEEQCLQAFFSTQSSSPSPNSANTTLTSSQQENESKSDKKLNILLITDCSKGEIEQARDLSQWILAQLESAIDERISVTIFLSNSKQASDNFKKAKCQFAFVHERSVLTEDYKTIEAKCRGLIKKMEDENDVLDLSDDNRNEFKPYLKPEYQANIKQKLSGQKRVEAVKSSAGCCSGFWEKLKKVCCDCSCNCCCQNNEVNPLKQLSPEFSLPTPQYMS